MKSPIIHLPDIKAQEAVYRDLVARGYRESWGGWSNHSPTGYPYLSISDKQLNWNAGYLSNHAIMNSPRHLLSYLARMPK